MSAYRKMMATNTTMVLSTESDLFKFLKSMKSEARPAKRRR